MIKNCPKLLQAFWVDDSTGLESLVQSMTGSVRGTTSGGLRIGNVDSTEGLRLAVFVVIAQTPDILTKVVPKLRNKKNPFSVAYRGLGERVFIYRLDSY